MSVQISFGRRLALELMPTPIQTLGCIVMAFVINIVINAQRALDFLGITNFALDVTRAELHGRFEAVLTSPISASLALITFWSGVGLISYLVCWGAYSLLLQARNEVTLNTEYTNRGHWRSPYHTLALKAVSATFLFATVAALKPGLAFWLAVSEGVLVGPDLYSAALALGATLALAVQLYLILAFALLTFTPWYRPQAFTDAAI